MSESMEKFIKESLEKETPPKLNPFFAAKVSNKIKSKVKVKPIWQLYMLFYWGVFTFFTFMLLTDLNWTGWGLILIIICVPLTFIFPVFRETS